MVADLRPAMLVLILKNKKKNHFPILIKIAGLIKKLVNKNLYPLLNNKIVIKI